jgi:serine/threonine protein phosphatase PrpC
VVWRAIVRSAIGTGHQQEQHPCQDYGGNRILNDVIVGAVADGAGSAAYSDIGAKLAVETTLSYLATSEAWLQKRNYSWHSLSQPPSEEQVKRLFTKSVGKVRSTLQKQATESGYSMDDLACTLLAFLATPQWIAAMQIGDGFIVVRRSMSWRQAVLANDFITQGEDYQLLLQPSKGEFANQTTFVTSLDALEEIQVRVLSGHQTFICVATDGLENVAIRLKDWTPFSPFFKPLEEYMQETAHPEQNDDYLVSFLTSERLNERTDDDKTLLLCLYQ